MNNAERILNYTKTKLGQARRGSDELSGPQRRRLRKNANKALGTPVLVDEIELMVARELHKDKPESLTAEAEKARRAEKHAHANKVFVTHEVVKVEYKSGIKRTFKVKEGEDGIALLDKYRSKDTVASAELTTTTRAWVAIRASEVA